MLTCSRLSPVGGCIADKHPLSMQDSTPEINCTAIFSAAGQMPVISKCLTISSGEQAHKDLVLLAYARKLRVRLRLFKMSCRLLR
jgi:hypothetical protein